MSEKIILNINKQLEAQSLGKRLNSVKKNPNITCKWDLCLNSGEKDDCEREDSKEK